MSKTKVCLTYDFDAVSLWIHAFSDYREEPANRSRGLFGVNYGVPRLLELQDKYDIKATFFTPGHTIDSFPEICEKIVSEGHDIQHHGWSHKDPSSYSSKEEEMEDIKRAIESIKDITGEKPTGYRSPSWRHSPYTLEILEEFGFEWDSSRMGSDFYPYYAHKNSEAPENEPYVIGEPTEIVELPITWKRDDFPPFSYVSGSNWGFADEDVVFRRWREQFDWMYKNVEDGVIIFTMHPQVSGRINNLIRIEELIQYIKGKANTSFEKLDKVAQDFKSKN